MDSYKNSILEGNSKSRLLGITESKSKDKLDCTFNKICEMIDYIVAMIVHLKEMMIVNYNG